MPLALLTGPLFVAFVWRLSKHWRWRLYSLLALFLTQLSILVLGSESRWGYAPWSGHWFDLDIPEQLMKKPALYLSIGTLSRTHFSQVFYIQLLAS